MDAVLYQPATSQSNMETSEPMNQKFPSVDATSLDVLAQPSHKGQLLNSANGKTFEDTIEMKILQEKSTSVLESTSTKDITERKNPHSLSSEQAGHNMSPSPTQSTTISTDKQPVLTKQKKTTPSTKSATKEEKTMTPNTTPHTPSIVYTPSKRKFSSRTIDKIHTRQIAKQPTLYEHEEQKKERAAILLSSSKSSVLRVRNHTKKRQTNTVNNDDYVTKTLVFDNMSNAATLKKTPIKAKINGIINKPAGYQPYVGPIPQYEGDSTFTPKKQTPRTTPMSVAVMKATRVKTPNKPNKPIRVSTPFPRVAKKTHDATNKENTIPNKQQLSQKTSNQSVNRSAVRSSVKTISRQTLTQPTKASERRVKAIQESKLKSAASRQTRRLNSFTPAK